jgi:hypothetical protein
MVETRKPARNTRAASAPKPAAKQAAAKDKSTARKTVARAGAKPAGPSRAEREARIRTAAYLRAERRGFAPGYEWEDWLAAEAEVDALRPAAAKPKPRKVATRKAAKSS